VFNDFYRPTGHYLYKALTMENNVHIIFISTSVAEQEPHHFGGAGAGGSGPEIDVQQR
jgi:hypothetical protein